ncbi:MAG TPA: DUF480 domain-containing protein [Acidimicrobiales bacterium]|nr:DUF480 domain-containing protein [Acidimicrobiales bacterium]
MFDLDAEEQRVLGTLIEKQLATPQYYPLTLSALVAGCNQTTSREPVTSYAESEVKETLLRLKDRQLLRTVLPSHGRSVDRYGHRLDEQITLIKEELALLAVLMLRGAQTENELKSRTERLADWEPPDTVGSILDRLAGKDEPLVRNVGRGPGQSQDRWIHLLGPVPERVPEPVRGLRPSGAQSDTRLDELEARVAALETEMAELRERLGG